MWQRERISRILELREILLSIRSVFSLVNATVACAILESISGLEPSSAITEPRYLKLVTVSSFCPFTLIPLPAVGAADAKIKVPSGENTELKRSPFKVWSRSVYSHTCYAYCQEFLPRLFLPFRSIHLHLFQNLSQFFPVLAVANTWFLCRPT